MNDFIKRGYIEFKTLTPVHIGCGRTVSKKEYLFDQKVGKIEILQMDRVFDRICALGLAEQFENYLLSGMNGNGRGYSNHRNTAGAGSNAGNELIDFVRENNIPESEYSSWSEEIVPFADPGMAYHSIKDISLFVRNARGLPYVPGSGFKGMLRTILETEYYLKDRKKAERMGGRIRDKIRENDYRPKGRQWLLKEEDAAIDVESMHKELFAPQRNDEPPIKNIRDQKNDILRGLLVGDSDELSWDDMCICEKIDINTYGEEKKPGAYREAIRPGVTIRIPISIDTRICPYTTKDILMAIKVFYEKYNAVFTRHFKTAPAVKGNSTTFFLGGGTGYASKTVTLGILREPELAEEVARIINATLGPAAKQQHGHHNDAKKGVSPHMLKCTRYRGNLLQMGACCVTKYV